MTQDQGGVGSGARCQVRRGGLSVEPVETGRRSVARSRRRRRWGSLPAATRRALGRACGDWEEVRGEVQEAQVEASSTPSDGAGRRSGRVQHLQESEGRGGAAVADGIAWGEGRRRWTCRPVEHRLRRQTVHSPLLRSDVNKHQTVPPTA